MEVRIRMWKVGVVAVNFTVIPEVHSNREGSSSANEGVRHLSRIALDELGSFALSK
jgi:hypothetical protein